MQNKKKLKIALYICALLALAYTGFMLFYSYSSITTYYANYGTTASGSEIAVTLISNAFTPFMTAVILYALGDVVGMLADLREDFEIASEKPGDNEVVEEKKEGASQAKEEEPEEEKPVNEAEESKEPAEENDSE